VNKEVPELLWRTAQEFILTVGVVVMSLWRTAASACLLVLLTGCTDDVGGGTEPPAEEPTEPETPQPSQRKPSIELASAPIGGNVEVDGETQCAEVNWLGVNPIPEGTTITIGAPHLEPGGVFDLYPPACAEKFRSCAAVIWDTQSFKPCYVGVRQVASGETTVQLIIAVSATCATEEDCKSLEGDRPGSQISFSPGPPGG
jgi:hypothetical protein